MSELEDLDYQDTLEGMEAFLPTEEELKEDEVKEVVQSQPQVDLVMEGFALLKSKPSDEQVETWKKQYGRVFTVGLNDDEYYIFRPLKRQEWRQLLKALEKQIDEHKRKEAVVARAVLWPDLKSPVAIAELDAGTPDTLYELVLQASNFLLPQEALQLVRKL